MNRYEKLGAAVRALLEDMRMRAALRGDIDPDGTVILDCGATVLRNVYDAMDMPVDVMERVNENLTPAAGVH